MTEKHTEQKESASHWERLSREEAITLSMLLARAVAKPDVFASGAELTEEQFRYRCERLESLMLKFDRLVGTVVDGGSLVVHFSPDASEKPEHK